MVVELKTEPFLEGLRLPEGLRWRHGKLWFTDIIGKRVYTADAAGNKHLLMAFEDDSPSGLGFLEDGSLVVSMMWTRELRRIDAGGNCTVHADFKHLPGDRLNDMVMDGQFRAYIDNNARPRERTGPDDDRDLGDSLIMLDAQGNSRIVASGGIIMPNGIAMTADMKTLILAEVFARRLTAFTIADDGSLVDRRLFASTGRATPDGICLDAEGAVWLSSPHSRECIRILEGGKVTHRISYPVWSVCPRLGGPDGRTLFVATTTGGDMKTFRETTQGRIETVTVDVPGAGW